MEDGKNKEAIIHKGERIRSEFEEWVEDVSDITLDDLPKMRRFVGTLWHCNDLMPSGLCDRLDMPQGSTYAKAVRTMQVDLRLDKLVEAVKFKDEEIDGLVETLVTIHNTLGTQICNQVVSNLEEGVRPVVMERMKARLGVLQGVR